MQSNLQQILSSKEGTHFPGEDSTQSQKDENDGDNYLVGNNDNPKTKKRRKKHKRKSPRVSRTIKKSQKDQEEVYYSTLEISRRRTRPRTRHGDSQSGGSSNSEEKKTIGEKERRLLSPPPFQNPPRKTKRPNSGINSKDFVSLPHFNGES